MKTKTQKNSKQKRGSVLGLIIISMVFLSILGAGILTTAYGIRHQATVEKNEAAAMLAAEAGYEKAIFWMTQQPDLLTVLSEDDSPGGSIYFQDSSCDYTISFYAFIGARPVYRILSNGHAGLSNRTCKVLILQAIGGWESSHRVPSGPSSTMSWPFAGGEVIDIPIHVNKYNDSPDIKDIYINGSPDFRQAASFGESQYAPDGTDKYSGVMDLFDAGIYFNQPDSKITDASVVQKKIDRFKEATNSTYKLTPVATAAVTRPNAAVQLEFYVKDGVGMVKITNNCTVRGYRYEDSPGPNPTFDYKIDESGSGDTYKKYDIYAYHLKPDSEASITVPVTNTYVSQSFGGVESEPGGQIYIDGNVIIGGNNPDHDNDQLVQGKVTVVATGNIWIGDNVKVAGNRDGSMPKIDNPNILGLIAQSVIKVADPGMSDYSYVDDSPVEPAGFTYIPIGRPDGSDLNSRKLTSTVEVEAAMTVGGGGWGAENVANRKNTTKTWFGTTYDKLVVRGTITEATRGIVGCSKPLWSSPPSNGYMKNYFLDKRLLQGVLPGDIWMKGKYIPAPAGWHDYRPSI